MRPATFIRPFLAAILLGVLFAPAALAVDVKMRIVVINPSTEKTQTKSIKNLLPKEVQPKNIKDLGGLDVDYDNAEGSYYVYKNDIPLAPGETKTYEVIMEDVWMVAEEKMNAITQRVDSILKHLKDTPYAQQGEIVAQTVRQRLEEIRRVQNDQTVTRQQHIAYYRDNAAVLEQIQTDIDKLEKMLVAVGGPPNVELMEKSKIDLKSPSQKTTWIVIFIILLFIMILAAAFYFTWQGQAKVTENIFKREKNESFSEFQKPKTPGT
jgi:hypothetical protein